MAAVAFPRQQQHATLAPFQWQINGTTQNTMCCAALFITVFVFTVCLLRRYDSVTSWNLPPQEERPQSVDNEVLRRRLRGVLISQVRAFAHVFTCPMRVVTEWPLLFPSCSQSGLSSSLTVLLPHLIFFLLLRQHPLLLPLAWQTFHLVPFSSCNLFVST